MGNRCLAAKSSDCTHTFYIKTGDKKGAGTDGNVSHMFILCACLFSDLLLKLPEIFALLIICLFYNAAQTCRPSDGMLARSPVYSPCFYIRAPAPKFVCPHKVPANSIGLLHDNLCMNSTTWVRLSGSL